LCTASTDRAKSWKAKVEVHSLLGHQKYVRVAPAFHNKHLFDKFKTSLIGSSAVEDWQGKLTQETRVFSY
jgi:hypothetical protein